MNHDIAPAGLRIDPVLLGALRASGLRRGRIGRLADGCARGRRSAMRRLSRAVAGPVGIENGVLVGTVALADGAFWRGGRLRITLRRYEMYETMRSALHAMTGADLATVVRHPLLGPAIITDVDCSDEGFHYEVREGITTWGGHFALATDMAPIQIRPHLHLPGGFTDLLEKVEHEFSERTIPMLKCVLAYLVLGNIATIAVHPWGFLATVGLMTCNMGLSMVLAILCLIPRNLEQRRLQHEFAITEAQRKKGMWS